MKPTVVLPDLLPFFFFNDTATTEIYTLSLHDALPAAPPAEHLLLATDAGTTYMPAKLGAHELVLLHGQPGSAADWLQVAGRLPVQLHAIAADRPGYGSSQLRAGGFAANA